MSKAKKAELEAAKAAAAAEQNPTENLEESAEGNQEEEKAPESDEAPPADLDPEEDQIEEAAPAVKLSPRKQLEEMTQVLIQEAQNLFNHLDETQRFAELNNRPSRHFFLHKVKTQQMIQSLKENKK